MVNRYWVQCDSCGARYFIPAKREGMKGRCRCGYKFVLPYSNVVSFAKKAPLEKVSRYLSNRAYQGCLSTKQLVSRIYKNRRAVAIQKSKRRSCLGVNSISDLLRLSSAHFEEFVARLYRQLGYCASVVGRGSDGGIDDVEIYSANGERLWAIVQCKRYLLRSKISSSAIRDFAGAYFASKAEKGFFFTTSTYTTQALNTAKHFPWLTLYNGRQIVELVNKLEAGG